MEDFKLRKEITDIIYNKELSRPVKVLEVEAIINSERERIIKEIEKLDEVVKNNSFKYAKNVISFIEKDKVTKIINSK